MHTENNGLVTKYWGGGGGGATKREGGGGGQTYPYEKGCGGGVRKCLGHSERGGGVTKRLEVVLTQELKF